MTWLERAMVVFFVAIVAYTGYATVGWLLSPRPLNALAPALFVAFVTPDVFRAVRYGSNRAPTSLTETFAAGISTLVVLTILFSVGASTGDDVYTDQGKALAFWGGLFFVAPCLIMLVLMLIPKSRNRILRGRSLRTVTLPLSHQAGEKHKNPDDGNADREQNCQ